MSEKSSHSSKRQELIAIASRLFYEQGYGATGIKQIIEEAKIAKGTFYSHFSSKEELGLIWLRERHTQWNHWLSKELHSNKPASERIMGIFDFLARWMKKSNYRGCAFLNTSAELPDASHPMRAEVAAHKRQLHEMIQELFLECYQEKAGSKKKALAFTRQKGSMLFLLFEGALIEAQNFQEPWPIQVAKKEAKALIAA